MALLVSSSCNFIFIEIDVDVISYSARQENDLFFLLKMEIDKILAASKLCPLATTSLPKFVNFLFTVEPPR